MIHFAVKLNLSEVKKLHLNKTSNRGTGDNQVAQSAKFKNTAQSELTNLKRNPYLLDYEEQRRMRDIPAQRSSGHKRRSQSNLRYESPRTNVKPGTNHPQSRSRAAAARRKRIVRRQRIAAGLWVLCILVISVMLLTDKKDASASGRKPVGSGAVGDRQSDEFNAVTSNKVMVQGLPAEVFAAHPDWKEDLLTPNEYSRPGDSLEQVKNIFVHYTANPGTSAAQNRSYFEQQKDTHENSVSAHFIIGYNGEIIQCIPLDEIAYAVQTRNEDSISIECCFLAEDGSFTKETYDSLINLLAWLADSYGLNVDDILRHYDCGGKKCPLYYTQNPEEWEQLKEDVKSKMEDLK